MTPYTLKLFLGHLCIKSLDCALSHLVHVVVELNNLYPSLKLLREKNEIIG